VGLGLALALVLALPVPVFSLLFMFRFMFMFLFELERPHRDLLRRGVAGVVVSVALGEVAAGFDVSVPVGVVTAAGLRDRLARAVAPEGMKEHLWAVPATGVSVRRSPLLRARIETITGGVAAVCPAVGVATSPNCTVTAV
jgi:hypothetical protein